MTNEKKNSHVWVLVLYRRFLWFRLAGGVWVSGYLDQQEALKAARGFDGSGYEVDIQPVKVEYGN